MNDAEKVYTFVSMRAADFKRLKKAYRVLTAAGMTPESSIEVLVNAARAKRERETMHHYMRTA